jgi:hypothetical protein
MTPYPVGLLFGQPPPNDGCRSFSRPTYLTTLYYTSLDSESNALRELGVRRSTPSSIYRLKSAPLFFVCRHKLATEWFAAERRVS